MKGCGNCYNCCIGKACQKKDMEMTMAERMHPTGQSVSADVSLSPESGESATDTCLQTGDQNFLARINHYKESGFVSDQNILYGMLEMLDAVEHDAGEMACYCNESCYGHKVKDHKGKSKALLSYDNYKEKLAKMRKEIGK